MEIEGFFLRRYNACAGTVIVSRLDHNTIGIHLLTEGYLAIILMVFVFGGYVASQLNRPTRITHLAAGVDSCNAPLGLEPSDARIKTSWHGKFLNSI